MRLLSKETFLLGNIWYSGIDSESEDDVPKSRRDYKYE